ncbi:FtsH protease activity modulator HflK [Candidatus Woesearchaeota archaeon]|nr:FtsH protease activity modulator HflK [Candidatus Woesearchaeota archaeon]
MAYDRRHDGRGGGGDYQEPKILDFNIPGWIVGSAVGGITALVLGLTTWYNVNPSEEGVVTRFGAYHRTEKSGFHGKLPWPIEKAYTIPVSKVYRIELGFRTLEDGKYEDVPTESQMLTGDENIVRLDGVAQFQITDTAKYLFNVRDPEGTIKDAAEAANRQVVGDSSFDATVTTGKLAIQDAIQIRLQEIVDTYDMGVKILPVQLQDVLPPEPVVPAFQDVVNAIEGKHQRISEAEGYQKDIIPKARGQAQKTLNDADAYYASEVGRAKGEVAQFLGALKEYTAAPESTETRLKIEMQEWVYSKAEKVIDGTEGGPLKFLDLKAKAGHDTGKPEVAK